MSTDKRKNSCFFGIGLSPLWGANPHQIKFRLRQNITKELSHFGPSSFCHQLLVFKVVASISLLFGYNKTLQLGYDNFEYIATWYNSDGGAEGI